MHIKKELPFEKWRTINNPLLEKNGKMEIISSENITVGKAIINHTMEMAEHSHVNEQVTIVIEGEMKIEYDGKVLYIKEGEACIIPSSSPHKVWITKVPFRSFDIFSPIKEDFIENALFNKQE